MSHFNNNTRIPDHEQFMAYVKGKLSATEKQSFEMAVESDAFLSEALEGYQKNPDWVGSISQSVNAKIQSKYPGGGSVNPKYIYLSVAALLVVILTIVFVNFPTDAEEKIAEKEAIEQNNPNPDQESQVVPGDLEEDQEKLEENESVTNFSISNDEEKILNDEVNKKIEDEIILDENKANEDDYQEDIIVNLNKKKDIKRNDEPNKVSGSAQLVVADVAIAIKENPAQDGKTKTKLKKGQVVTIDKTKNNKNYNQDDLPSYDGGDDALLAEIKGSIKPRTVQLSKQYDRVIGFDFEVAANGKVDASSLRFLGNPYPEMRVQIQKAIQNLPNFIPGKAKGNKGRIRYAIMMKY